MPENSLSSIMHAAAMRMRAEFMSSRAYLHRGESGTARQQILADFLARYLPHHVKAFNSAELITIDGDVSPQCDIVIADRDVPPLLGSKTYRILPNECVYGVIEAKTGLNQSTLLDACELIKRVKSYPKSAFYPNPGPYGSRTAYGNNYPYCPTSGMIFAFDGTDITTLGKHLLKWCSRSIRRSGRRRRQLDPRGRRCPGVRSTTTRPGTSARGTSRTVAGAHSRA
jgi:hypothetical protein